MTKSTSIAQFQFMAFMMRHNAGGFQTRATQEELDRLFSLASIVQATADLTRTQAKQIAHAISEQLPTRALDLGQCYDLVRMMAGYRSWKNCLESMVEVDGETRVDVKPHGRPRQVKPLASEKVLAEQQGARVCQMIRDGDVVSFLALCKEAQVDRLVREFASAPAGSLITMERVESVASYLRRRLHINKGSSIVAAGLLLGHRDARFQHLQALESVTVIKPFLNEAEAFSAPT